MTREPTKSTGELIGKIAAGLTVIIMLVGMGLLTYFLSRNILVAKNSDPCQRNGVTYCVLNSDVTQNTIHSTICVSGWTATVRPPVSYTNPIKVQKLADKENLVNGDTNIHDYELDHRVPLELGGSPAAIQNLSLEYGIPNPKDSDENSLKREVCSGKLSLVQAQTELIAKWLAPYPAYKN